MRDGTGEDLGKTVPPVQSVLGIVRAAGETRDYASQVNRVVSKDFPGFSEYQAKFSRLSLGDNAG
jgi:hypothetical protein